MANVSHIQAPTLLTSINTVLAGLTYPADAAGRTPQVRFMGTYHETADEQIELVAAAADGAVDWYNTGRIQTEAFTVEIVVRTATPGVTGPDALTRVDALAQVVQDGFRNITTGKPAGLTADGNLLNNWRFESYDLTAFPVEPGGWGFEYTLRLRLQTHR